LIVSIQKFVLDKTGGYFGNEQSPDLFLLKYCSYCS